MRVEKQDEVVMLLENKTATLSFIFVMRDVSIWFIHLISMRLLAIFEKETTFSSISYNAQSICELRLSHAPKQ